MTDWDRILSCAPLNREAATVTAGADEPSGFRKPIDDPYLQDGPHKTRKPPVDPTFKDITGWRFGKLTVLGLSIKKGTASGGSMWSVRCDCSRYTLKRIRPLLKGNVTMCCECDWAEQVRTGKGSYDILKGGGHEKH